MGPVEITRGFTCYDQYPHDLGEGYGGRGIMGYINGMGSGTFLLRPPVSRLPLYLITPVYPATALSHYPLTPFLSRHPTISFRMASREGRNCLQDLMRHIHCRRAILTRYHRPRTLAGCLKERFELELQRFFISTLQLGQIILSVLVTAAILVSGDQSIDIRARPWRSVFAIQMSSFKNLSMRRM